MMTLFGLALAAGCRAPCSISPALSRRLVNGIAWNLLNARSRFASLPFDASARGRLGFMRRGDAPRYRQFAMVVRTRQLPRADPIDCAIPATVAAASNSVPNVRSTPKTL
jgi:hypothetical protein